MRRGLRRLPGAAPIIACIACWPGAAAADSPSSGITVNVYETEVGLTPTGVTTTTLFDLQGSPGDDSVVAWRSPAGRLIVSSSDGARLLPSAEPHCTQDSTLQVSCDARAVNAVVGHLGVGDDRFAASRDLGERLGAYVSDTQEPRPLGGGPGRDTLIGGDASEALVTGGSGADVLRGRSGGDALFGGAGPDRLYGGAGADALDGGPAPDVFDGGGGRDRCREGLGVSRLRDCEVTTTSGRSWG